MSPSTRATISAIGGMLLRKAAFKFLGLTMVGIIVVAHELGVDAAVTIGTLIILLLTWIIGLKIYRRCKRRPEAADGDEGTLGSVS